MFLIVGGCTRNFSGYSVEKLLNSIEIYSQKFGFLMKFKIIENSGSSYDCRKIWSVGNDLSVGGWFLNWRMDVAWPRNGSCLPCGGQVINIWVCADRSHTEYIKEPVVFQFGLSYNKDKYSITTLMPTQSTKNNKSHITFCIQIYLYLNLPTRKLLSKVLFESLHIENIENRKTHCSFFKGSCHTTDYTINISFM